jgi:hypothetical protein
LTASHYFEKLFLLSEKTNENYLKSFGLMYQESRNNNFDDNLPRNFLFKFDKIDLFYNCDLLLSASEDINDLALIWKYFKRQNLKYKVQLKTTWIESFVIKGNIFILDWFLGGKRYLKLKATDINTLNTDEPWSKKGNGSMHYSCSTMTVTHTKYK